MKKQVFALLLACLMLTGLLAGCGGNTAEEPAEDAPASTPAAESTEAPAEEAEASADEAPAADYLVGFANNSDTYDYCAKFRALLADECAAQGIDLMVTDAGGDTNVQNGQIDDFIVQEAQIVSAISNDLDGSVPALDAAREADIPYVSFLTTVRGAEDYDKYIYVGSQNVDAGRMQGEYLKEALPENAKVLYFTGQPNDQQYIDRKAGLEEVLAERSDIEWLAEYNTENQKDKGLSTAEDCMQAYDSFDAIICQNDDSALGAVEALKSAGRLEGVTIVGIDGSDSALASIAAGELTCSILQDAAAQAQAGADVFARIRDGEDAASIEDIYVPFQIVTADNVADYTA